MFVIFQISKFSCFESLLTPPTDENLGGHALPAAAALADVLGLGRIFAGVLAHLAAGAPLERQLGQVGGAGGLGQLAPLHHLPQQHTNTAM